MMKTSGVQMVEYVCRRSALDSFPVKAIPFHYATIISNGRFLHP